MAGMKLIKCSSCMTVHIRKKIVSLDSKKINKIWCWGERKTVRRKLGKKRKQQQEEEEEAGAELTVEGAAVVTPAFIDSHSHIGMAPFAEDD